MREKESEGSIERKRDSERDMFAGNRGVSAKVTYLQRGWIGLKRGQESTRRERVRLIE